MALTASNNESFSNPISNANRSAVQGNMMASPTSLGGFEVVTPVLSTAKVLIEIDPKLPKETTTKALTENKANTAKATPLKKSTEIGMFEEAIEMKESAEGGKIEEATTKAAPATLNERKTITVDGSRHVEVSHETHSMHCIVIDGTCYVPESAPILDKTAYSLIFERANLAKDEGITQEQISRARFNFRGQPIMIHVGTQSYSVHASILVKSHILGSMPLEEADDGSYFLCLPSEDPTKFEELLTYMYQGTWEPEQCEDGSCWGCAGGQSCSYYNSKKNMQIYAIACKYAVHGLAEKIALKLDLTENVLSFCEAFKCAYEMCSGSHHIRSLFRRNLVQVFENTSRRSAEAPKSGTWGNETDILGSWAVQLAELASCGGEFAVDLMQAFTTAGEDAVQAEVIETRQKAFRSDDRGNDDWGNVNWACQTVEGGNDWGQANNEGHHQADQDAGCLINTAQAVNDRHQSVVTSAPVPGILPIREDVEDIQGRVRYLEDMVSRLEFIAETSVQTQQPAFQQPPNGSAPGYIAPGWGPDPSVPAKVSWPSGWD